MGPWRHLRERDEGAGAIVQVVAAVGPEFTTERCPEGTALPPAVGEAVDALRAALPGAVVPEALRLEGPEAAARLGPALSAAAVLVGVPAGGMAQVTFAALASAGRPVILVAAPPEAVQQAAAGAAALRAAGRFAEMALGPREASAAVEAILRGRSGPEAGNAASAGGREREEARPRGGERQAAASRKAKPSGVPEPVVLQVGGVSASVVDGTRDPAGFAARTGARLVRVEWPEVLREADALPAAEIDAAAEAWRRGADGVDVGDALLRRNAGVAVALERLAARHGAAALAIDCVAGTVLGRVTPCLAFTRLEDAGVAAGCEGDLTALEARLLLREVSGRPGFTANLGAIDVERRTVVLWHHTVPLSFAGGRLGYALRPYGSRGGGFGVHAMVRFPEGLPVTVVRLDARAERAAVAEGEVVDGSPPPGRNHSRMVVRVASAAGFLASLLGNHHAVAPGRWGDAVAARLEAAGVRVARA